MLTNNRAIAASLEDHTRQTTTTKAAKAPVEVLEISDDEDSEPTPAPPPPPPAAKSSFLSERAQMEKERRERARKFRQAAGLKDDDDGSDGESSSRPPPPPPPAAKVKSTPKLAPAQPPSGDQLFFDGELRPIAVQGCEPRRDGKPTFRLTQALGKVRTPDLIIPDSLSCRNPTSPLLSFRPTRTIYLGSTASLSRLFQ